MSGGMHALFYVSGGSWNGAARAFIGAARGLTERGNKATLVCVGGSAVEKRAAAFGVETLPADPEGFAAGDAWWLRRIVRERRIDVALVHGDRDQFVIGSAVRMAIRGRIVRRVPSFQPLSLAFGGRMALRVANTGLLFTTEGEQSAVGSSPVLAALPIGPTVAPLGIDTADYDAVRAVARTSIGVPAHGLLIVCCYEPSGRTRLATALRTLSLLAPRHPEIHLAVLGPGSLDEDLRMHAAALGLSTRVTFLGPRPDETAVLRAADVGWVVAAGDDGAFAFLDFMAMRIPVVADRGELQQHYVADGITGVLLSPGALSHTAASVAAFLAQGERRAAMGNAARARAQRDFSHSAMIEGYERALSAARRPVHAAASAVPL
jgi:glycosyl transferase family 1